MTAVASGHAYCPVRRSRKRLRYLGPSHSTAPNSRQAILPVRSITKLWGSARIW